MNNTRRKEIDEIVTLIEEARDRLDAVLDEEQDYYDYMPESIQSGEKGDVAQEAIDNLNQAIESLDEAVSSAQEAQA